jgi:hypothetical protein
MWAVARALLLLGVLAALVLAAALNIREMGRGKW